VARSIRVALVVGLLAAAGTIGLIVLYIRSAVAVSCEVCIPYGGQVVCRTALGPSREEAVGTATDNACAFLARGMTDSIRCANTTPTQVTCEGDEPTQP